MESSRQIEHIYANIHAMDTIMRSLNDEDILESWLECGVPDGTDTLEDVRETYDFKDEKEAEETYEELYTLFAKLVREATEDGFPKWIW